MAREASNAFEADPAKQASASPAVLMKTVWD